MKKENTISILEKFKAIFPGIELILVEDVTLLGAALGEKSIDTIFENNIKDIPKHQAFFLIKNCFAIPKLLYIISTSAVFKKDKILQEMHDNLKDIMESIVNISTGRDTWTQLTLPVKLGGFGLQYPIELTASAFILLFVFCSSPDTSLFNNHSPSDSLLRDALSLCQPMTGETSNTTAAMTEPLHKQWTIPVSKNNIGLLIEQSATDL